MPWIEITRSSTLSAQIVIASETSAASSQARSSLRSWICSLVRPWGDLKLCGRLRFLLEESRGNETLCAMPGFSCAPGAAALCRAWAEAALCCGTGTAHLSHAGIGTGTAQLCETGTGTETAVPCMDRDSPVLWDKDSPRSLGQGWPSCAVQEGLGQPSSVCRQVPCSLPRVLPHWHCCHKPPSWRES